MEMSEYVEKEAVLKLIDTMKKYLDSVKTAPKQGVNLKCAMHMANRLETLSDRVDKLNCISITLNEEW